jgi:lysyl-tRNA synthetase class 2
MKRLLAEGCGDIYQLAHVFRRGEVSAKHNPEFMMAEWYRVGMTFPQIIDDTLDFISLFLGVLPRRILSYRDAFRQYLDVDVALLPDAALLALLDKHGIVAYAGLEEEGRDAILNLPSAPSSNRSLETAS